MKISQRKIQIKTTFTIIYMDLGANTMIVKKKIFLLKKTAPTKNPSIFIFVSNQFSWEIMIDKV